MARILVVEDEFNIRFLIMKILQRADHETLEAENGREALELLDSMDDIDLVISDLLMSEINGLELLEHTKLHHPDIPVILLTVHTRSDWAKTAKMRGADCYLLKPFTQDQLLTIVDDVLGARHGTQARFDYLALPCA